MTTSEDKKDDPEAKGTQGTEFEKSEIDITEEMDPNETDLSEDVSGDEIESSGDDVGEIQVASEPLDDAKNQSDSGVDETTENEAITERSTSEVSPDDEMREDNPVTTSKEIEEPSAEEEIESSQLSTEDIPDQSGEEIPQDVENDFDLIQAIELTKVYGDTVALNSINFTTSTQALGILGPNGCGKSTFLKLLLKLLKPTKGSISMANTLRDIRVIPDYPTLPSELTIDEWMEMLSKFHGKLIHDIDIQERLNLNGSWKIRDLSAGQYRKAALLPAFFGTPQLIILDEPTNFLDIVTREYVLQLLSKQINDHDSRVIIASHRVDEIRLLANQAVILKNGSMIKTIHLDRHPIRSYEIVVEQEDQFMELMRNSDIIVARSEVAGRNVFEIPNYPQVWQALFEFTKHNGTVVSLRSVDELDKNIEELLK